MSEFNWAAATPEERRAHWVTKLRSGEYRQVRNFLHTEDGHCCLGVLCDIASAGRWHLVVDQGTYGFVYEGDSFDSMPPGEILLAVGVSEDQANALALSNDDGETFAQIAARIETIR